MNSKKMLKHMFGTLKTIKSEDKKEKNDKSHNFWYR